MADRPSRILVPVARPEEAGPLLRLATALLGRRAGRVIALGVVEVPDSQGYSQAASRARMLRRQLQAVCSEIPDAGSVEVRSTVRVSRRAWQAIRRVAIQEQVDLVILGWAGNVFGTTLAAIVRNPPVDLAIVRGDFSGRPMKRLLLAARGGPQAELAFRWAAALAEALDLDLTVLNVRPRRQTLQERARAAHVFAGVARLAGQRPRVSVVTVQADDPESVIMAEARTHDLLVLGATAEAGEVADEPLGAIPERIARLVDVPTVIVRTREPLQVHFRELREPPTVLVEQWFAENTFHAREFSDVADLVRLKRQQGVTISLVLPALNEAESIGAVIRTFREYLQEEVPLLDEILVVDSGSTDGTSEVARAHGAQVYLDCAVRPDLGSFPGRGEALWKSLFVSRGDIVVWVDAGIKNPHPKFVYGLVGPLLREPRLVYVKGYWRLPGGFEPDPAGWADADPVTEILVRPALNMLLPELSGFILPLSAEHAGRREALIEVPFLTGPAVELGLLIDIYGRYGLERVAQVDLEEKVEHPRRAVAPARIAFAILQGLLRRLESRHRLEVLATLSPSLKLPHYDPERLYLEVIEVEQHERPPVAAVFGRQLAGG
jgi:nucleotide-binding universal stress UspA family protein